ncbi:Transposase [Phytophthora megakarya]|uniref:Transposase n=1 Tax=Phytophthora megakarya TaxID=4795 RepID=A0A225VP64_9STRA|nr:Transposase [Phytophthora megakarya]
MYNPTKPTGKYHFQLYVVCCSTSATKGVIGSEEVQALSNELDQVSTIRQHVLEVVRPLFGTSRVVNMDNYYCSVQLLQALRLKGLYACGTVRNNSKHFPRHAMLDKRDKCSRGEMRYAVSVEQKMVAASWCDGSINSQSQRV